ncbi:MAG: PTS sugar transporter subunit IIA [Chlamydiae bacterium]|nr:PTS sugar transporter subunit IIA [Chlamydiota bacterium]
MDLKIRDVAELLDVSETTIRRWIVQRKIPVYRLNHQYRFSRIEIENWMMKCKLKNSLGQESLLFAERGISLNKSIENEPSPKGGLKQFSLYRAIHHGGVYREAKGTSKEEIIREVMKMVAEKLNLDGEVLTDLLLDRERMMPTALNHGIAVPHARDFLLELPFDVVAVAYPKEPIEYGALDKQKVHTLFFLFATNDKNHLHLLAKIAHLGTSQAALDFLKTKPEKTELLDYIRNWEGTLNTSE